MKITDKIQFWLDQKDTHKQDWEKMGIKTGKGEKTKKKKVEKPGTRLSLETKELKDKIDSPKTLECSVCGNPLVYEEMRHFTTPRGTHSVCKKCLAEKGKSVKEQTLKEDEAKDLTKYLKSMRGKPEKAILKGLMTKFDLSKDDAERALELM